MGAWEYPHVADHREGTDLAATQQPDLIVLDLGLPDDASGLEVCREIREWSFAPILVRSARHGDP
jgi:two-component system KDP operon response regulator KdpE